MAGSASEAGARPAMSKTPARQRAAELEPIIRGLQQQGVTSLVEVAKALNQQGIPTHRGGAEWTPVNVARMLARTVSCAKATAVRVARSQARAAELQPVIAEIRASGITSLGGIARGLNEKGIPTAWGKGPWRPRQVKRVLDRLEVIEG